ncbi:hypothetical protein L596_028284 [Steinernema carpocapsae]|uniref:Uncharacterized protein n=1 Tax=Steinernema carpocapsae TaxID=34508 RepID=A0A4U5LXZ6_STECR|nr:hypothetical protein L596_028284 [Steinernema carpocapsae]
MSSFTNCCFRLYSKHVKIENGALVHVEKVKRPVQVVKKHEFWLFVGAADVIHGRIGLREEVGDDEGNVGGVRLVLLDAAEEEDNRGAGQKVPLSDVVFVDVPGLDHFLTIAFVSFSG